MPNEDGYSLITKLRKLKTRRAKEIPAIALTAYATKEDQERTLASGFQMHVAKPIDPERLITSIAKAMGKV
jgi:CheY-like chemotaxis protein